MDWTWYPTVSLLCKHNRIHLRQGMCLSIQSINHSFSEIYRQINFHELCSGCLRLPAWLPPSPPLSFILSVGRSACFPLFFLRKFVCLQTKTRFFSRCAPTLDRHHIRLFSVLLHLFSFFMVSVCVRAYLLVDFQSCVPRGHHKIFFLLHTCSAGVIAFPIAMSLCT